MDRHIGRSWDDTHLENSCPCPKEPCGLVNQAKADPRCFHHPVERYKTMRQGHRPDECPGGGEVNRKSDACDACGDLPETWCPDCAACRSGCYGGDDGTCDHLNAPWDCPA